MKQLLTLTAAEMLMGIADPLNDAGTRVRTSDGRVWHWTGSVWESNGETPPAAVSYYRRDSLNTLEYDQAHDRTPAWSDLTPAEKAEQKPDAGEPIKGKRGPVKSRKRKAA